MLNYRRQRSLTDLFKFEYSEGKISLQPGFLASSIVVAGVASEEPERKKFLTDNAFLKSAFDKAQQLFNFEGKFAALALVSMESSCLFAGTGSSKDFYPKKLLHLGGKLSQQLDKLKTSRVVLLVDSFYKDLKNTKSSELPQDFAERPILERNISREEALERLLTGFLLAVYKCPNPKNLDANPKKAEKKKEVTEIQLISKFLNREKILAVAANAMRKAEATYWVRDEVSMPPNVLIPEAFVKEIRELGEKSGFKIKVLDENRLQKDGFGGIWSVGKGSVHPPRLVIAEYNVNATKVPHLVLVGKGVTFDTGGISIKPAMNMHEMKEDMTGAAVVSAVLSVVAKEKLPIKVTALLPIVENRPSYNSFLPGDVFEAWGGTTVEVQNTDAEGRLILCDCLAYAQGLKADLVIDMATLTGAASVTLGPVAFLLYGNRAEWTQKFLKSTHIAGEEAWEMPLYDEYSEDLKSDVAHLRNHVGHREGNSHVAAQFLNFFVDDKYPWLHLDIAAYANSPKWKGAHCPPDSAAGLPTLAVIEFVKSLAKKEKK